MKKLLFYILLLVGCNAHTSAQNPIGYDYDASGNRLHRKIITLPSQAQQPGEQLPPVEDNLGVRKVDIFPNPTQGNLMVRITGGKEDEDYSFTLFNGSGLKLFDNKVKGQGDHPVDLSQYSNGVYILILKTGKEKLSFKIIKE